MYLKWVHVPETKRVQFRGCLFKEMNAKIGFMVLVLLTMLVCQTMAMPRGNNVGSSVTVTASPPEITALYLDPDEIAVIPGTSQSATLTAEVFCPNGVDRLNSVAVICVMPFSLPETTLPMSMRRISVEDTVHAVYEVTFDLPCYMPAGDYTITVTALDRDGNIAMADVTGTVWETLAFSVTDVNFGSVAPGKSSEASSTVTNLGNVRVEFKEKDGIVPSDMHAGGSGIIKAENIAVDWDWKTVIKRGYFSPGENTKEVPFTLKVPYGTPPGTYTGRIVFTPTPAK
jgi:hypothetical protein